MAIREDETAASAMGVNLTRFKLLAFAIGAAFAGMTGVFYVAKLQTATPEMFGFPVSVDDPGHGRARRHGQRLGRGAGRRHPATAAILVPAGPRPSWMHAFGDAIGSDWLQQVDLAQSIELIFGIILVVMMLFRRDGLIPATRKHAGADASSSSMPRSGAAASSALERAPAHGRRAAATRWRSAASPCGSAA